MKNETLRIFLGYDEREVMGFHVCVKSLIDTCSVPFSITPISSAQRDGTNAFTYARFFVPEMCNYEGTAIFADGSDMLFLDDVSKISYSAKENECAVSVVKRNYITRATRKYIGTEMEANNEDYPRKNWSSLMVWDCGHPANKTLTRHSVGLGSGNVHRFNWLHDTLVGDLPSRWNVLVGEDGEDEPNPALLHYTLGIPAFRAYRAGDHAKRWLAEYERMVDGWQV